MTEITVYVEGGGHTVALQAELRRGFEALFAKERSKARDAGGSVKFVCCGGRQEAYQAFKNALKVDSERVNALLVDSETPMPPVPDDEEKDGSLRLAHLRRKEGTGVRQQGDGWVLSDGLSGRIHMMVQCMEAWIVADPNALEEFYKQKFKRNSLPARDNLEDESKDDLYEKLKIATKDTQKGEYGKIKHAGKLLEIIKPGAVSKRCPRFKIFQEWLNDVVDG